MAGDNKFGLLLDQNLKRLGISQELLGQSIGKNKFYIQNLKRGKGKNLRSVDPMVFTRLIKILSSFEKNEKRNKLIEPELGDIDQTLLLEFLLTYFGLNSILDNLRITGDDEYYHKKYYSLFENAEEIWVFTDELQEYHNQEFAEFLGKELLRKSYKFTYFVPYNDEKWKTALSRISKSIQLLNKTKSEKQVVKLLNDKITIYGVEGIFLGRLSVINPRKTPQCFLNLGKLFNDSNDYVITDPELFINQRSGLLQMLYAFEIDQDLVEYFNDNLRVKLLY